MKFDTETASNTLSNSNSTREASTNPTTPSTILNEPCTPIRLNDFPPETPDGDNGYYFGCGPLRNAQDMFPWVCPMCYVWEVDSGTQCAICGYETHGDEEDEVEEDEEDEYEDDDEDDDEDEVEEKYQGYKKEMSETCIPRV
jgi:hypothetical protein